MLIPEKLSDWRQWPATDLLVSLIGGLSNYVCHFQEGLTLILVILWTTVALPGRMQETAGLHKPMEGVQGNGEQEELRQGGYKGM